MILENNILNIEETVRFLEQTVKIGELVSVAMIQRKFRTGYATAKRTFDKLIELGYVDSKEDRIIRYYRKN